MIGQNKQLTLSVTNTQQIPKIVALKERNVSVGSRNMKSIYNG